MVKGSASVKYLMTFSPSGVVGIDGSLRADA